jgi:small-conductance mechanosensitive channel
MTESSIPSSPRPARLVLAILLALGFCFGPASPGWAAPTPPTLEPPAPASTEPGSQEALDRQTPRKTVEGFLKQAKDGNFRLAASYLDLGSIPVDARDQDGPELAQKLAYFLQRQPRFDPGALNDDPEGPPGQRGTYVAAKLYAGEEPVPIVLKREHFPDGVDRWLIAESTVDLVPRIGAAAGPRPIVSHLPAQLRRPTFLGNELWQWIGVTLGVFVAYFVGRGLATILVWSARLFTKRMPSRVLDALVKASRRPLRLIIAALAYRVLLDPLGLTASVRDFCEHLAYSTLVIGLGWLGLRALGVSTVVLEEREQRKGTDAFSERRVRTRTLLLRRVAGLTIGFVSFAFLVIQFQFVRSVGISLLASAGVFSVVIGFAAQKSLSGIIGGIQFSIAQPVRVRDQVVVEGEFGEIEEVHLTYVVVRLWDKRRMILPTSYFLEKPFQNWTRSAMDVVGTVVLKIDPVVPVDAVREELHRICEADPLWDKKTCVMQVTDADLATTPSLTVRALVSAEDAARLWDLRCRVREYLADFVQTQAIARKQAQGGGPRDGTSRSTGPLAHEASRTS